MAKQGIVAKDNGFFYTYVTNRSAGKVNFDNMTIKHWAPVVRVVYDYYPYGLTWENPALPTDPSGDGIHDCAYQDKEFQFAEFTTGHGLALYDFHARMYDPCTARWLVPDPAAQFANPYLAMGNNPVISIDPDGQWIHILVGAIVGGVFNTLTHLDQIDDFGDFAAAFGIGAVAGAVGAATFGAVAVAGGAAVVTSSGALVMTGVGGFGAGAIAGAGSGVFSTAVQGIGNGIYFGDAMPGAKEYAMSAVAGALGGGLSNGIVAKQKGLTFWKGTGSSPGQGVGYTIGPEYKGKTGYGNRSATDYLDEDGLAKSPDFYIKNESAADDIKLFGTRTGYNQDLKVDNFKYQDVLDYVSEGQQVKPFSASGGGTGYEVIAPTRDGLLKYHAYPAASSTSGPTIKVDYWNSSLEKWQFWTTFRFAQ